MGCTKFWLKLAMHSLILWFCVYYPDDAIIQYKYPNRIYFDCKTKVCPIVPGRQGKYIFIFTQASFNLQGTCILDDINEHLGPQWTHLFLTVNTIT